MRAHIFPETIWKFPFQVSDIVTLEMPEGARVIAVQSQGDVATMWAIVDPDVPKVQRVFYVVGTGRPLPTTGEFQYIATFQLPPFVWHIFE